jgi:hypothetical protein
VVKTLADRKNDLADEVGALVRRAAVPDRDIADRLRRTPLTGADLVDVLRTATITIQETPHGKDP